MERKTRTWAKSLGTLGIAQEILNQTLNKQEDKQMETKSRYEVIADLEEKKRNLIRERDGFKDKVFEKEKEIKEAKRDLEDEEEELKHLKETQTERKATITELIKGLEQSLQRFEKLQKKS